MLAAVLLAAGGSRRFGRANKLLATWRGRPLIAHALDALIATPAQRLIVVTGSDRGRVDRVIRRCRDPRLVRVHNAAWREGLASSIRAAIAALRPVDRALLVFLADMPAISQADAAAVRRALARGADAARPMSGGQPGHPTGFRVRSLSGISPSGDEGLWSALAREEGLRIEPVRGRRGAFADVDTRAALRQLRHVEPGRRSRV